MQPSLAPKSREIYLFFGFLAPSFSRLSVHVVPPLHCILAKHVAAFLSRRSPANGCRSRSHVTNHRVVFPPGGYLESHSCQQFDVGGQLNATPTSRSFEMPHLGLMALLDHVGIVPKAQVVRNGAARAVTALIGVQPARYGYFVVRINSTF